MLSLATSVDVECTFSCGCLVLLHICNRLSAQTTQALMCVGIWSKLGLVHNEDVSIVAGMPDLDEDEVEELADDWDMINLL